ncbi:hypothetical protein SCALM49S_01962 [Streptomyces californicus]
MKLVDTLREALAGCGPLLEQQNPGLQAVSASHGKLAVEEGAWVYSLDTADPQIGISDIHLFSVGRDGRTVTLVRWGQMGELKDAPLTGLPHHNEDRRQQAPLTLGAPRGAVAQAGRATFRPPSRRASWMVAVSLTMRNRRCWSRLVSWWRCRPGPVGTGCSPSLGPADLIPGAAWVSWLYDEGSHLSWEAADGCR